jgi:hypothetical protein
MTTGEGDQKLSIDGTKYKTWGLFCRMCGTIVPSSIQQINWLQSQMTGKGVKEYKKLKPKELEGAETKFKTCFCGEKCVRGVDYIKLNKKFVEVIGDVCTACHAIYITTEPYAEVKPLK